MRVEFTKWTHYTEQSYTFTEEYETLEETKAALLEAWKNNPNEDTFDYDYESDTLYPTVIIARVAELFIDDVRDYVRKSIAERLAEEDDKEHGYLCLLDDVMSDAEEWLSCNFFQGLDDPESIEVRTSDEVYQELEEAIHIGEGIQPAIDKFVADISVYPRSIGTPVYTYNAETDELKPYMEETTKYHTGDRVRIISNPSKPDTVGKIGTILMTGTDANTKEGLYQVQLDGDKTPLYGWAEECCLELVEE